jgi:hypothetical protein
MVTSDERIQKIERSLEDIAGWNQGVELDKAWETSWVRHLSVLVFAYIVILIIMYFLGIENPLRNALMPTFGFFLSVQTLPWIKRLWIRSHAK